MCIHGAFGIHIEISKSYNNYDEAFLLNFIPFIIIDKICKLLTTA